MRKVFLIGFAVLSLLSSCSEDEEIHQVFKASELTAPADNSEITENTTTLEWKKNEDNSSKYDVFLGKKAELSDVDKVKSAISETKCTVGDLIASTTYFWKVKSINAQGEILDSKVFSFTTGLKASSLIAPADKAMISDNSVSLEWAKNEDADAKYDVFLGTKAELTVDDVAETAISELKFLAKDLLASTTYFWKVKTVNSKGVMLESSVFSFTTAMKASGLIAPADKAIINENSVSLEWSKNADADAKYDVLLANKADFSDVKKVATGISLTNYTVEKLAGGETFYWKVNSINKAGEIFESAVFSFSTVFGASNLVAPADKSIIKENSVKLEWTKNVDLDAKYDVFIGTKAELTDAEKVVTGTSELSYLAENIEVATTYYWKVNTINGKGEILETTNFSFSNGLPSIPVLSFPKNNASLVKLTTNLLWSKSTLFDGAEVTYNILYATTADFETNAIKTADLTATKFSLEGLAEDTSYSWKVVARNADGDVAESEVFTFTTHKTPVTTLLLPADKSTGAVPELLKWETKEGFTYNVYLSKGSSTFTDANMVRRHAILGKYTPSNIEAGATYYWKIHAINAASTEFASEVFSFTTDEADFTVEAGTFTDSDNHIYKTTIINGVEWLAENYAFIPTDESLWMIPGKALKDVAYDDVANDDNYKKYGLLYSIDAITPFIPAGWHVATDEEWNNLEIALGMSKSDSEMNGYRSSHAAALKSDDGSWTTEATNISKMNILAAGMSTVDYSTPYPWTYTKLVDFGKKAYVWTGTAKATSYYCRMIYDNESYPGVSRKAEKSKKLMSVRLVKNVK